MRTFWQDLRYALRALRRRPGFVAVVGLTLALGVGVNTAVFSVVHAVLLAPLPFRQADRVVTLSEVARTTNTDLVSPITFVDWQERNEVFDGVAGYRYWQSETLENGWGDAAPAAVLHITATPNLFAVLGIQPILGRTYIDDHTLLGAAEAVLSYDLWQRRFGGDRQVLGKTIRLRGTAKTIVGVMPPVRAGMLVGWGDVWSPLRRYDIREQRATQYKARYLSIPALRASRVSPTVALHR